MPLYYAKKISRLPEESFEFGEGLDRSFMESYEVILDTENSTTLDVSGLQLYEALLLSPPSDADRLPQYGDRWVSRDGIRIDNLAIMRRVGGRRDRNDKAKFTFNFTYTPRGRADTPNADKRDLAGGTDNLDNLFPEWTLTTEDRMETPVDGKDLDGKKVVNSAGDVYESGSEFNFPLIVLNYSRHETSFNTATASDLITNIETYKYCTNSDTFLITGDAGKWLMTEYVLRPVTVGPQRVIKRDMTIKYNPRGWKERLLNAGLNEVKNPALTVIETGWGLVADWSKTNKKSIGQPGSAQPITKPWPLDLAGRAISNPSTSDLIFNEFRFKGSVSFSPLGVQLI